MKQPRYTARIFKVLIFSIMIFMNISSIEAQEKQRIVVTPFNPINISQNDVELIYGAFESALIKTDIFFVIDRNEIKRSLEDEEYTLFECTNDQCAVELGELLSAWQVVVGSLSYYKDRFVLRIKTIDVSNGEITYTDTISVNSLNQMINSMELFAFKLAGLTIMEGGKLKAARRYSELFIETIPSRADIYINGVKKGVSPDIISRVPLGRIRIAAQKGELYGERIFELTENVREVQIELTESFGSLLIKAANNLDVYMDNRWLGKLGLDSFSNLSIGIHTFELKDRDLYWSDEVVIRKNECTVIEAQVKEYGAIEYSIPAGAIAEIRGSMFREVVRGYGTLPVPADNYSITVTGKNYEKYEVIGLLVPKGTLISLKPDLDYTREYEYELFNKKIEEVERIINFGYRLTYIDIKKFKDLKIEIDSSKHSFAELISGIESLIKKAEKIVGAEPALESAKADEEKQEKKIRLDKLITQKQWLEKEIESSIQVKKRKTIRGWTSFGLSLASGGLAVLFHYLSNEAYWKYERAATYEEALKRENEVKLWDISTFTALGTGGLCLFVSSVLWLSGPSPKRFINELESVDEEIMLLEGELQ